MGVNVTVRLVGGPMDGASYPTTLPGDRIPIVTLAGEGEDAQRYHRDDHVEVFEGAEIEFHYVARNADYLRERGVRL